jgi:alpha-amylase
VEYELQAHGPIGARFGVEFNVALLNPASLVSPRGTLSEAGEIIGVREVSVEDDWHGLRVAWIASPEARFVIYPVQTVSQSESGFELSHQSTVIMPCWDLRLKAGERWTAVITQKIEEAR